jgi:hypothetical protein
MRVRGRNAMLDADLALLYGVSTKQLIQAMKRIDRGSNASVSKPLSTS